MTLGALDRARERRALPPRRARGPPPVGAGGGGGGRRARSSGSLGTPYATSDGVERPLAPTTSSSSRPTTRTCAACASTCPTAVRVGTVDKFQGQEAPVVFFSMASSSGEDVPRGLDFLFSRNRLNVAISRAQCLAYRRCEPAPPGGGLQDRGADAARERAVPLRRGCGRAGLKHRLPVNRRKLVTAATRPKEEQCTRA